MCHTEVLVIQYLWSVHKETHLIKVTVYISDSVKQTVMFSVSDTNLRLSIVVCVCVDVMPRLNGVDSHSSLSHTLGSKTLDVNENIQTGHFMDMNVKYFLWDSIIFVFSFQIPSFRYLDAQKSQKGNRKLINQLVCELIKCQSKQWRSLMHERKDNRYGCLARCTSSYEPYESLLFSHH